MRNISKLVMVLTTATLLAGCGGGGPLGIFKKSDKVNVPGERVAVLVNNVRSKAHTEYAGTNMDRSADKRWFVFPWEAVAKPDSIIEDATEVPERLA